jgi:hypothetical protein
MANPRATTFFFNGLQQLSQSLHSRRSARCGQVSGQFRAVHRILRFGHGCVSTQSSRPLSSDAAPALAVMVAGFLTDRPLLGLLFRPFHHFLEFRLQVTHHLGSIIFIIWSP